MKITASHTVSNRTVLIYLAACVAMHGFSGFVSAAVTDSVTIYDTSGTARTNSPITISRVFADGEIANYAQPLINGTAAATWQVDRKTSWSDGSASHEIITLLASIPANGSVTITFRNSTNACYLGSLSACQAAALSQGGMTGFNSGSWNADIEATGGAACTANAMSGNTCQVTAQGVLNSGNFRYWLQGPVVTQVIAEDRSTALTYDFGWDAYKPIHPMFILTFYPSYTAGVKVDAIVENDWTTKLEDQTYTIAEKSGASLGTTAYTQTNMYHWARSRMRQTFWSGTALPSVNVDFNLAYMAYSGAIPNYDSSKAVGATAISNEYGAWTATNMYAPYTFWNGGGNSGLLNTNMSAVGGRPEIGLLPRWATRWLYTHDPTLYAEMIGNAEIGGQIPWHYRESSTTRSYLDSTLDPSHTYNAFGRLYSADARSNISLMGYGTTSSGDAITAVGTVSCANGAVGGNEAGCTTTSGGNTWGTDPSHHPMVAYLPYLVTADYYYLEEIQAVASWLTGSADSGCGTNAGRCGNYGLIPEGGLQERGMGWGFRSLAEAAFVSPDASPEKAYFTEKLNNNIQVKEGEYNIQNGSYYNPNPGGTPSNPCPSGSYSASAATIWCYGQVTYAGRQYNPLALHYYANNQLLQGQRTDLSGQGGAPWHHWYAMAAWAHARDLGFSQIDTLLTYTAKNPIHQALDPTYAPTLAAAYMMPIYDTNGNMFTTWAAVKNAFAISGTLTSAINATTTSIPVSMAGTTTNSFGEPTFYAGQFGAAIVIDGETLGITTDDGGNPVASLSSAFSGGYSISLVPSGSGRGSQGSTAASHSAGASFTVAPNVFGFGQSTDDVDNSYAVLFQAVLAMVADASDSGLAGLTAYNTVKSMYPMSYVQTEFGSNNSGCAIPVSDVLDNCDNPKWAIVPRVSPPHSSNACDLNGDGVVNSTDVQIAVGQAIGSSTCTSLAAIDGSCNVIAVQRITNAALGQTCKIGQ